MGELMNKHGLKTKSDVEAFVRGASLRQSLTAIKLVMEWNGENKGDLINPIILLGNANLANERQTIVNRFPELETKSTQPTDRQQVALGVLNDLERIVITFIKRDRDYNKAFVPIEADDQLTAKATKLLKEVQFLKERPSGIDINDKGVSPSIAAMCSMYQEIRAKSLPRHSLQTLVYEQATRLATTALSTDPNFAAFQALYLSGKKGTTAQFKGLVGEYLGLLAAERHFTAKPSGVTWTHVFNGVCLIEVCPLGNASLPGRNEPPVPHAAPQLYLQGSVTHYGQPLGELDRLLCSQPGHQFKPLIVLESKGGENSTNIVRAQMKKMAANLVLIAQNPQRYRLAERAGNEYVDINNRFILAALPTVEILSTGPERRHDDQFDIGLGITSEEMDMLLTYLAHNPPACWGRPPLEEAPVQVEG